MKYQQVFELVHYLKTFDNIHTYLKMLSNFQIHIFVFGIFQFCRFFVMSRKDEFKQNVFVVYGVR